MNRNGEVNINNFGSKMVILQYRLYKDIDIYFPEYKYTKMGASYKEFKNGRVACPYEPRTFGIGYLGEGKYKTKNKKSKKTKYYITWESMLERCYNKSTQEKRPTYKGCTVCVEWLNFQNFAKWYEENYYEIPGEIMCLDKDILHKGNKIYSPDTCVFVPNGINTLFTKSNSIRGELPIGVSNYTLNDNFKYVARCGMMKNGKKNMKHLGLFNDEKDAFNAYKIFKEKYIKEVADYYKKYIPRHLYEAMYRYNVEITD